MTLPSTLYRARPYDADPAQDAVLQKLDALAAALRPRWFARAKPRGLYIHGTVGRGKSMLMDLFYEAASPPRKRRAHFNAFMLDVHRRLHAERRNNVRDPLARVTAALAKETRLLCFDEFQVGDIADAMILARLFEGLLDNGVIVVATSNAAPDDLYRDGLQRALFLPFIALLKQRLDVIEIGTGLDHRLARLKGRPVFFTPDDDSAASAIDAAFAALTEGEPSRSLSFDLDGRALTVPRAAGRVGRFTFAELCDRPLGAADYLALAARFAVIIVEHIPRFEAARRNESLRFISLVDQMYERHTVLIVSAEAPISALYPPDGPYAFEFRRTCSRLEEMQSKTYLAMGLEI